MRPSLFEIFGEPVPAYFTLLCFGFALATWFSARWAERAGYDREVVIDVGLLALLSGIVGSRLLHVFADGYFWDYVHLCTDPSLVEWKISRGQCAEAEGLWDAAANICRPPGRDCFAWAAFWRGGLTYYGGLVVAVPVLAWFVRREGIPILEMADAGGTYTLIGLVWGRLGCFLGGCCFGRVTDAGFPLAVRFPAWSAASEGQYRAGELAGAHLESLPVHPTQLYESLACALLGMALTQWGLPRKRFRGQAFLLFVAGYAAIRFCLEFLRADDRGGVLGLSTSQWISLAAVVLVALFWRHWAARYPAGPLVAPAPTDS